MARTDYGAILSTVIKDTSDSIREVERSVSNIAPNAWGTHIRSMKNDSDYQNVIDNLIEETISDTAIASFTDGAKGIPLKNLVVDINAVQSGSGTPSPTNVRAISGWSSCNVTRCGKNIADIKSYNEWETFDAYRLLKNTLPNTLLIMSITNKDTSVDVSGCYFGFFSNNYNSGAPSNYVWAITGGNYSNVSNLKNGEYLGALAFYPQTEETYNKLFSRFNIQIEVGSTATAYEAYNGGTDTIALGQTVYGGSLNVSTGLLTIDRKKITLNGTENVNVASQSYIKSDACDGYVTIQEVYPSVGYADYPNDLLCDKLKYDQSKGIWTNVGYANCWLLNAKSIHLNIANSDLGITDYTQETTSTVRDKITSWITANQPEFVIPVVSTTVQLTPTEVQTIIGNNNIFADSGNVSVVYRANGQLYVEQNT